MDDPIEQILESLTAFKPLIEYKKVRWHIVIQTRRGTIRIRHKSFMGALLITIGKIEEYA